MKYTDPGLRERGRLQRPHRRQAQGRLLGRLPRLHEGADYEGLLLCAATTGARVGQAAALAQARGAEVGLAALDAIPPDSVSVRRRANLRPCDRPFGRQRRPRLSRCRVKLV